MSAGCRGAAIAFASTHPSLDGTAGLFVHSDGRQGGVPSELGPDGRRYARVLLAGSAAKLGRNGRWLPQTGGYEQLA
jgi:hypothetical protein